MTKSVAFYNPYSRQMSNYMSRKIPVHLVGLEFEARNRGMSTLIVDEVDGNTPRAIERLARFKPDILCVSTYFRDDCFAKERSVIEALRRKARIILGGYDVTTNDLVLEELKPSVAIKGEGEIPFAALVQAEFEPSIISSEHISTTYRNGVWILESRTPFDLDHLPLPNELSVTPFPGGKWEEATVNVARGCVGRCSFCIGGSRKPVYMSAGRVIEQLRAWIPLIYPNGEINLLAPDFTAIPRRASQIIREINRNPEIQGRNYSLAVRVDTMARALEIVFEDGQRALEEWMRFLTSNRVMIEIGVETLNLSRLGENHLNKTNHPEAYQPDFEQLLSLGKETGTKIGVDLIVFDPETRLDALKNDFDMLSRLAAQFPNIHVYPDALFREIILYPGSRAAESLKRDHFSLSQGAKRIPLRPYKDRRVEALRDAFRGNQDFFGIDRYLPLTATLARILALVNFMLEKFPDADNFSKSAAIYNYIDFLREHPEL